MWSQSIIVFQVNKEGDEQSESERAAPRREAPTREECVMTLDAVDARAVMGTKKIRSIIPHARGLAKSTHIPNRSNRDTVEKIQAATSSAKAAERIVQARRSQRRRRQLRDVRHKGSQRGKILAACRVEALLVLLGRRGVRLCEASHEDGE